MSDKAKNLCAECLKTLESSRYWRSLRESHYTTRTGLTLKLALMRAHNLSLGSWRLIAVVATILVVLIVNILPNQTRTIHYNPNNQYGLSFDQEERSSSATWLDDYSSSRFKCTVGPSEKAWCGYVISWPSEGNGGLIDISNYHSVMINLKYVGPAKKLRIYMRAYHPDYGSFTEPQKNKFQSVTLFTDEFNQSVTLPFSEFVVADWWMVSRGIPRHHTQPSFDAIQSIAVDFPQPGAAGEHVMEVRSIEFVGEYIAKETAYLCLLILWLMLISAEGVYRYYLLNIKVEKAEAKALTLANYARQLRAQSSLYKKLSGIDPLTGAYNRAGLKPLLDKTFSNERRSRSGVLMVVDIDHFKRINDDFGHAAGDSVIKRVAHTIADSIRIGDLFARWGGEEFVLICPEVDRKTGVTIGEKLRTAVSDIDFNDDGLFKVTVSVGVTEIVHVDSFDSAFERADKALYGAKENGRNRVVFQAHLQQLAEEA